MTRSPRLLVGSALCFAAVWVLWVAVPHLKALDDAWLHVLSGPHGGAAWALALILNGYGRPIGLIVPISIVIVLLLLRRWWSVLFFVTGRLAATAASNGIKTWTQRDRPPDPLITIDSWAFPSGHVVNAASTVVLVAALLTPVVRRYWWIFGAVFTVAMMWSRAYLHLHWLTDTVAGALVGAGVALAWWWIFEPRLRPEQNLLQVARSRD